VSARRPQRGFTARRARGFILLAVVLALTLIAAVAFLLNRGGGMNTSMAARGLQTDSARYVAEAGLAQLAVQTRSRNCAGYTDLPATTFGAGSFSATVSPRAGSPVALASTATLADGTKSTFTRTNVVINQTTPYALTLQPGTPGQDTYIYLPSPNFNYGADTSLTVQSGRAVALLQFDLSAVPAGSTILSAKFSLYHQSGGNDTVSVFGLTKPWIEGTGAAASGATWSAYDGVNFWATAGGDYDRAAGLAIVLPANNAWATWDLTAWTAAWEAGIQPNYGIALAANSGGINTFVSSDEPSSTTLRPKLDLSFLPPCGWVPGASGVTLEASQDTWIDEAHSNSNYGSSIQIAVSNAAKSERGLLRFDLSGVPSSKVLKSATLRLFAGSFSNPQNSILTVNPVNVPWTEAGASWKTADGTINSWKGGGYGGNFGAPSASATISSAFTSGWVEWDVTALAQQWLGSPSLNYGVGVLIDTSSEVIFNSREFTVNQPQLVLTF
jgi:hypothetical protein